MNYVTEGGSQVGMWLSLPAAEPCGNPNFLMTPERKALLDQIGMHWTLRRMKIRMPGGGHNIELLPKEKTGG
ncbi:MAG: hypothetical protein ACLT9P_02660 [Evtepia gabavorous]